MDHGTIGGQYTEWYENGAIKEKKCCKFGITLWRKEFDLEGNIVQEMTEPNETGKRLLAKYTEWYEKDDSGNTATN